MTCKGIRKQIPLLVGRELSAKQDLRVKAHLDRCPGCRQEAQDMAAALEAAKGLAHEEGLRDWTDTEWRQMLRALTAVDFDRRPRFERLVRRPVFASGLALLIFAATLLWLTKNPPLKLGDRLPQARSQTAGERPKESGAQDVISMTLVSQETGLKIVWFFDNKFEWKENQP